MPPIFEAHELRFLSEWKNGGRQNKNSASDREMGAGCDFLPA
jgi:hypothetical protein